MVRFLFACFVLLFAIAARAQGGPPFRTDDPETPGNRHFEINFGFIADRNPATGAYQVPDFDINYGLGDRIQLKYELPIALAETGPRLGVPASDVHVLGGLGESLLGIKWRFYERHPHDAILHERFGTGLLPLFHHDFAAAPAQAAGDSPGAVDSPEQQTSFSIFTYPQLFLDNPTRSVPRGIVMPGPQFFLPIEVNARIGPVRLDAEAGYNFGNRNVPQSWGRGLLIGHEFSDRTELYLELYDEQEANRLSQTTRKSRETTLGLGGRQALNSTKTMNLLLMGGRSYQTVTPANGQPSWIAYVGLQVLFSTK